MRRTFSSLAILGALACGACGAPQPDAPARPAPPSPRDDGGADVTVPTADGVRLAATVWAGGERCVVLVHQLSSTRDEWAALVDRLRGRHEVLAFDVRGHGGSTRGAAGPVAWRELDEAGWRRAIEDLRGAAAWLRERGLAPEDCAYVGSSIGASLVVRFAAEAAPAAVVLLSPGLTYRGLDIVDAAAAYGGPALVIYGDEPGAAEAVAALEAAWGDRLSMLHVDGTAHGVALLDGNDALLGAIASFIDGALAGE